MLPEVDMTPKQVFRDYSAALARGDRQALAALVHEDFQLEGAGLDGIGKAGFIAAMNAQMDAFPNYSENPSDLEERGDRVSFIAHVTGTQRGALILPGMKPVAPTGKSIHLPPEPAWIQVRDEKLVRYHVTAVPGGGIQGILSQLA
jgi:ketosteroid isomerase-like protein